MKNYLLLAITKFYMTFAFGQKSRQAYCEVIVWSHHIMFNAAVTFDFGMQTILQQCCMTIKISH